MIPNKVRLITKRNWFEYFSLGLVISSAGLGSAYMKTMQYDPKGLFLGGVIVGCGFMMASISLFTKVKGANDNR